MPGQRAEAVGGEGGRTGVQAEEGPCRDGVGRRDSHRGRPQQQEVPLERHRDEARAAGMMVVMNCLLYPIFIELRLQSGAQVTVLVHCTCYIGLDRFFSQFF